MMLFQSNDTVVLLMMDNNFPHTISFIMVIVLGNCLEKVASLLGWKQRI